MTMALDREQIQTRLTEPNGGAPDLSGLDLTGADLSRMDLRGVNLSRADLSAADLRWAVLEGADLHSSVMRRADVRWAIMRGANLRQADLGRANLGWADLTGADLSGAELDGASLDNVDLSGAITGLAAAQAGGGFAMPRLGPATAGAVALPRAPFMPEGFGWRPGAWSMPRVTPATVAALLLSLLVLVQGWGWLYRRAYYLRGWELDLPGLVSLGQGANFSSGVTKVIPLTVMALISAPLAFLALTLLLALVALPVLLLWLFGERVLSDIVRPRMRPVVVGGLFVAYVVIFLLFIIPGGLDIATWVAANGLPGDRSLRTVGQLFVLGGVFTKLGLILVSAGCGYLLWIFWRWLSHKIAHYEVPLDLRLRYPALNSAAAQAREAAIFSRNEPLNEEERRRGLGSLVAVLLVLASLLTGAGRVQAYYDMCDGGKLPRLQLFHGDAPPNVVNSTLCQRLVIQTRDAFYVFFPGQTNETIPGDISSRKPNLREVKKTDVLTAKMATGQTQDCPSCADGPSGDERFVVHPNEQRAEGLVRDAAGNLVMLDLDAGPGVIDGIRIDETTLITKDGSAASLADIEPGRDSVVAYGALDIAQPNLISARDLSILSPGSVAPGDILAGSLDINFADPWSPIFEGTGWQPGSQVELRLVRENGEALGPNTGGNTLTQVTIGADGSFSVPYAMSEQVPTGPDYKLMVIDPLTGSFQASPWLALPPPTRTPEPTQPPPAPTLESTNTPTPPEPEDATATAEAEATATEEAAAEATEQAGPATNTPLPTPANLPPSGGPPIADCEPDEYEPNNARGQQTVLYPTIGSDVDSQTHNFCSYGRDIDLFMFQAKAGRHYRVFTRNLAPGVDTVMAVGDLTAGTGCQPWHPSFGCWSDDRNITSLESEIIFEAIANDLVIVTVDNRGLRKGTDATYDIAVQQYEPGQESTGTGTVTVTPTATATRLPLRDVFDNYASNNTCRTASVDAIGPCSNIKATIGSSGDEDYYLSAPLHAGNYIIEMEPPDGLDYDMDVGFVTNAGSSRIECGRTQFTGQEDGDRKEKFPIVVPSDNTIIYIRIYPRPGSKDFDPSEYYRLKLCYTAGSEPPAPPPPPLPTQTPIPTIPPTWTSPPPTLTPTPAGQQLPPSPTP
jgi:hypothetical protein